VISVSACGAPPTRRVAAWPPFAVLHRTASRRIAHRAGASPPDHRRSPVPADNTASSAPPLAAGIASQSTGANPSIEACRSLRVMAQTFCEKNLARLSTRRSSHKAWQVGSHAPCLRSLSPLAAGEQGRGPSSSAFFHEWIWLA
jgi:hypothetical protein